jgi:hypothetical protein
MRQTGTPAQVALFRSSHRTLSRKSRLLQLYASKPPIAREGAPAHPAHRESTRSYVMASEPVIGDSDAVDVAREVVQHVGGAAKVRLRVDHLATPCVEALDPAAGLEVR